MIADQIRTLYAKSNGTPIHNGDPNFVLALLLPGSTDEFIDPYRQSSWVYTCVDILAKNFAGVELGVFRGTKRDAELLESGPLPDLFRRPNSKMSQAQSLTAWAIHMKTVGESIWVLTGPGGDPVMTDRELPSAMWPLPGNVFRAEMNGDQTEVLAWKLKIGSREQTLEPWQVLHFAYYNPRNPHRGLAPLEAVRMAARQDFRASQWNESVLANDGVPAGFFETESDLTRSQREELRERHQDEHGGALKKGKVAVLTGGMKFNPVMATHKEMEFGALKKWNRDEIFAVFRVPPFEAGLTEDVNRATAQAAKAKLFESAIIPDQKLFADTVNMALERWQGGEGLFARFDNAGVEALKQGVTEKLEQAQKLVEMGYPRDLVNERLGLGLEALPDRLGQVSTVPVAIQLLEDVADPFGDEVEEPDQGQPPPPQQEEDEDEERATPAVHIAKAPTVWQVMERRIIRPAERRMKRALIPHIRVDRDKTLRALRAADRRCLEGIRARLLEHEPVYCDAEGVLRLLSGAEAKDIDDGDLDGILFNLEQSNSRIGRVFAPIYRWLVRRVLDHAGSQLGGLEVTNPDTPQLVQFLREKRVKLAQVNETTRARVKAELIRGIRAGEGIRQLQERVRRGFRGAASAARRLRVARTETAQVANGTRHLAFEFEGITEHEWMTAEDEHVRTSHAAQNGVRVEVGRPFPNGLAHPGDPAGPAREIVNCRCVAQPVVR